MVPLGPCLQRPAAPTLAACFLAVLSLAIYACCLQPTEPAQCKRPVLPCPAHKEADEAALVLEPGQSAEAVPLCAMPGRATSCSPSISPVALSAGNQAGSTDGAVLACPALHSLACPDNLWPLHAGAKAVMLSCSKQPCMQEPRQLCCPAASCPACL